MALVTAAEYKTSRGIAGTDYDTRVGEAIDVASSQIRAYCGRAESDGFESAARTEYYDGNGLSVLHLREWPVTTITSVAFRTSSSAFGDTLDSTGYYVNPNSANRGELYRSGEESTWGGSRDVWPEGHQNIKVVYTGGYSTVPDKLKEAVFVMMDAWWRSGLRDNLNAQTDSMGVMNRVLWGSDEAAARLQMLLSEWKRGAFI